MSFSPIDKLSSLPPAASLEPAAVVDVPNATASSVDALLDPHAVLALDVWPTTGARVFDARADEAPADAAPALAAEELDRIASHVVSFLI